MGCTASVSKKIYNVGRKKKLVIPEVIVFVPTMRIPVDTDLQRALKGIIPRDLVDKLSTLRSQISLLAEDTGGSAYTQLNGALERYLPVVLGLTKKVYSIEDKVEFRWKNLQDRRQETYMVSSWFEVLCVVYMMAILSLLEANSLLLPNNPMDASDRTVSEDSKKDAIDLLIKAAGYLEFCFRDILICLPPDIKNKLPKDFQEGVLEALSIQALGEGTEMQLGLAVESQKASTSVKRRLACEQLSYFAQAHYCLSECDMTHGCGKKHLMYIRWKYIEAKAAAYYYHGLILDKGNEPSSHISAKIPEVASRKSQMYGYLLEQEKALQSLPDLPDFPLSLRPDDYKLPELDPAWESGKWEVEVPTLKEHLKDAEDGTN
ncbi:hypothetical protein IFM89_031202 [Coptis chinensis]|uniref:BRO1 domain-containing protein n=1 Tax=Coptis chinensis TaxID=261450 RepID=A0A835IRS7_9MAGN|nr:hypothetical protein IFM89_031202 [Coptis chinensis]